MKRKIALYTIISLSALFVFTFASYVLAEKEYVKSETTKVENFSLKDFNGKTHSLEDYKDSKAIVLMFVATECPVSNAYNKRMVEIKKEYEKKNITFLGINSNKEEYVADIKSHAKKNSLDFPILKDEKNIIADKLQASVTPEIYVINSDFEILYHGRIDDSRNEKNVSSRDLENALNEILSGKKVSVNRTKAFGCTDKKN